MLLFVALLAGGNAAPSAVVLVICVSILSDLLCSCCGNSSLDLTGQLRYGAGHREGII